MARASFDTLTYAKKLQDAGFNQKQAEAQAEALAAVVDQNLATKQDIETIRRDLKEIETRGQRDLKELESRMLSEFESSRREMKAMEARTLSEFASIRLEMKAMEARIVIRLGGMIIVGIGALAVLIKVL